VSPSAPGPGLAVVGTDTAVGKTVVTAGLTGWLRAAGVDARAVKPAQTGHPPDDDAATVAAACGSEAAATCCVRLEPPLAPRVAAAETGRELRYDDLLGAVRAAAAEAEVPLVEGIGGLRVPLAGDREVLDLVAELGLPAVLVARSGLGTLNHTALSVDALRRRQVPVQGVVLSRYEAAGVAERTNPVELERMTGLPVHTLPPIPELPEGAVEGVRESLPASVFPGPVRERL
jgi:dethiobiotin synthetase